MKRFQKKARQSIIQIQIQCSSEECYTSRAEKFIRLLETPSEMIVVLNIFSFKNGEATKIMYKIDIPDELNFCNYYLNIDERNNQIYKLSKVCFHYGNTNRTGHYTSNCFKKSKNRRFLLNI